MSYILEALKKADAERERGAVPGLHAQAVPLGMDDGARSGGASRPLVWICAGLALALAGLSAWVVMGRSSAPPPPEQTVAALPPLVPTPPPVEQAPPPQEAPPARNEPAPAIPPAPAPAPAPAPPAPAPAPRNVPQAAKPASPPPAPRTPPPVTAPAVPAPAAPAQAAARVAPAEPASAAAPRLYTVQELPDAIRREMPTLTVGGAMYSRNPANRMVIVNGQPVQEGAKLGPHLMLEEIGLKEAVLEFKGYRVQIRY